jgi:hypothetical protein
MTKSSPVGRPNGRSRSGLAEFAIAPGISSTSAGEWKIGIERPTDAELALSAKDAGWHRSSPH